MIEKFEIGDRISSKEGLELGVVIGIRSTKWSDSDFEDITYVISTPTGRIRRYSGKDLEGVVIENN